MSTVLPDLYKIAANATSSSIDQAIPRFVCEDNSSASKPPILLSPARTARSQPMRSAEYPRASTRVISLKCCAPEPSKAASTTVAQDPGAAFQRKQVGRECRVQPITVEPANLVLNRLSTLFNSSIEGAAVGKDFSSAEKISAPESSKPVNPAIKFSLNRWILRRVPATRRVICLKFGELMSGRVGSVACGLCDGSVIRYGWPPWTRRPRLTTGRDLLLEAS